MKRVKVKQMMGKKQTTRVKPGSRQRELTRKFFSSELQVF